MIKLNNKTIEFNKFPNGEVYFDTKKIDELAIIEEDGAPIHLCNNVVEFKFEGNESLIELMLVKRYLDSLTKNVGLVIFYMPYSRMDRQIEDFPFTLKYVSDFINSLGFRSVKILEPHSDVSSALIDNCYPEDSTVHLFKMFLRDGFIKFNKEKDYVLLPDAGAVKRYSRLLDGYKQLIGYKERDLRTGNIIKFNIIGDLEKGSNVVILDDLCSKGGTFLMSAKELWKKGANKISIVVTHCEETVLHGDLINENIEIYTTDSIIDSSKTLHPNLYIKTL